jgi:outer membrane protein OmpA-like peptidoglycan-associated protein
MVMRHRLAWLAALLACAAFGGAQAADEPGSKDNPLVGRYAGSEITFYKAAAFDEAALLQKPHDYGALLDRNALQDRSGPEWLHVEGRITRIRYAIPAGRSSLEVMRNSKQALEAKGFGIAFSCVDRACFAGNVNDPHLLGQQLDTANVVSTAYFDHARYMLASAARPEGIVYVAILIGEDKDVTTAFVEVAESKALEGSKIAAAPPPAPPPPASAPAVDAAEMQAALTRSSKVDLHGIYFEFDSDVVKDESAPTLTQIAALLQKNPALRLRIVGHTDNVGQPDYNLKLSARRATNVLAALVTRYGVAPDRLSSTGAGQTEPVASNDDEAGRATNRRVELRAPD